MKLSPNDAGEHGVSNVVPPPGESRAAAWRMANVDDLRNLRYDSGAITRARHAQWLHLQMHERVNGFNLVLARVWIAEMCLLAVDIMCSCN